MSHRSEVNRRDLLKGLGISAAALAVSPFLSSALLGDDIAVTAAGTKKILFFTKSAGFST